MSCTYELCEPKSTDCSIYKGVGCESKEIKDGDTLTSVLDKLIACDETTTPDTPTTETEFSPLICGGIPSCLVGISYNPIDWTMSETLGFSYDLSSFITSLGTDFSLIQSKVQVYSGQSIFSSNNMAGGFVATASQLPAMVDVSVVMNSLCGLISFTETFVITCSGTGVFQTQLLPKGGGSLVLTSQSDFNSYVKNELANVKNSLGTLRTTLRLSPNPLFPDNLVSQKSALLIIADNAGKLDERLTKLEKVTACDSECQTCPGGDEIGIEAAYNALCDKLKQNNELIAALTARIVTLENHH